MRKASISLLLIASLLPLSGCSLLFKSKGESKETSIPEPPTQTSVSRDDPYIKIIPLAPNTPYIGFTRGGLTDYKIEYHDGYGHVSYRNKNDYQISWSSSDYDIVDPRKDHWFVGNGKATLTATFHDYSADYSDSIEVTSVTRVLESQTNYEIMEYRAKNEYDLPVNLLPLDSSLFYEISDEEVISINEETRKIECLKPGKTSLKISYYGDDVIYGIKEELTYQIEVLDKDAPHFVFNQETAFLGTLNAPKNKYSSLDVSALGLTAFDKDNNDITNSVEVYEGEYSLSELGEYKITLKAKDLNNLHSYFYATLRISEKEITKTAIDATYYSLDNELMHINIDHTITNMSGLIWISRVDYTATITKKPIYDDLDVSIKISVYFKAQDEALDYAYYDTFGYIEGSMSPGKNSITLTGSFPNPNKRHLKASTYQETGYTIKVSGNGYNYIYY